MSFADDVDDTVMMNSMKKVSLGYLSEAARISPHWF
jgi:hypothetical protein